MKPKRTRMVAVRLTEDEYERVKARAAREKRPISSLLRDGICPPPVTITLGNPSTSLTASSSSWTSLVTYAAPT